jgi:hypothetical protein
MNVPDITPSPDARDTGAAGATPKARADALADAVRRTLLAMPAGEPPTSDELQRTIRAYAGASRAAGIPPERLLIAVAAIIADATPPGTSDWWHSVVRDRLIFWAIEGYYRIDIEHEPHSGPTMQTEG